MRALMVALTPEHVLALALHVVVAACAAWDIWALASGRSGQTVSNIVGEWSSAFPVLPFMVGMVLGHLFWPRRGPPGPGAGP